MKIINRSKEAFEFPGNEVGCLLIHGFTGSPGEMLPLGEYLHQKGYTVRGLLLPGHGTKPEDMEGIGWVQWYGKVEEEYKKLQARSSKVFIIGLSMGGALSLYLAAREKIAGVVAICAPIYLVNKKAYLTPFLKYFIKWGKKKNGRAKPYEGFWYDCYPTSGTASLVNMLPTIKRDIKKITCPALVIQSKLDKTVDPRSAQYIYDHLGSEKKELNWLYNSGHVATLDIERDQVFAWIEEFINDN